MDASGRKKELKRLHACTRGETRGTRRAHTNVITCVRATLSGANPQAHKSQTPNPKPAWHHKGMPHLPGHEYPGMPPPSGSEYIENSSPSKGSKEGRKGLQAHNPYAAPNLSQVMGKTAGGGRASGRGPEASPHHQRQASIEFLSSF